MFAKNMLSNFNHIFSANIFYYSKVKHILNPCSAHRKRYLVFTSKIGTSLLRMSLFHRCFFTRLARKNQLPGFSILEYWFKMG